MKRILSIAFVASCLIACKKENASSKIDATAVEQTTPNKTEGFAVLTVDKQEHDFGTVKKGNAHQTEFTVTNTGTSDLVIVDAHASCGCTVPEFPREPLKPGTSAKIKVVFTPTSVGMQHKSVTVKANTETGNTLLNIKANVIE